MTTTVAASACPAAALRRGDLAAQPSREVSRVERVSRGRRVDDLTGHDRVDAADDVLDGDRRTDSRHP